MSLLHAIMSALDQRKNNVLLVAQAALPQCQFEAFRKVILNELGRSGFQKDVETVLKEHTDR